MIRDESLVVKIGIAEGKITSAPYRLRTTGLGSCVGVVLYDVKAGLGGLVHVMLPEGKTTGDVTLTKYANLAVPWLQHELCNNGAQSSRLRAKIAGGAQMFAFAGKSDIMRVGPRNTEAVMSSLEDLHIPVVASDVGGNMGRTIEFDIQTSLLHIRTALLGEYSI